MTPRGSSLERAVPEGILLLAPLPALSIGILVMSSAGLAPSIWMANGAAALVGVLAALAAWAWRRLAGRGPVPLSWLLPSALVLLGATLMAPGVQGVHRWLPVGPVQLHAGALLLPPLLVALSRARWVPSVAVAIMSSIILLLQPDAAQAASFAAGWVVLAVTEPGRTGRGRRGMIVAVAALAAASLLRTDPLGPVPHVEGIVGMAAAKGLPWAAAGVASLLVVPASLAWSRGRPETALAAYTITTLFAAWLGHHPVPILGFGVSPILGYYLALTALALGPPPQVLPRGNAAPPPS